MEDLQGDLQGELHQECYVLVRHLLGRGVHVPAGMVARVAALAEQRPAAGAVSELARIHAQLADLARPASPRTIVILEQEAARPSTLRFLGPVPLIRQLTVAAVVCLVLFIGAALSKEVTREPNAADLFSNSGIPLLVNVVFLGAAAGLGAVFAALFKVNRYLANWRYDPRYDYSYWVLVVLGVISGIVLSELLTEVTTKTSSSEHTSRAVLALLGGFSAPAVHRILTRLVETVEELFRGSSRELIDQAAQAARVRSATALTEARLQLAGRLITLQQHLQPGADPATAAKEVTRILDSLVPLRSQSGTRVETSPHRNRPRRQTPSPPRATPPRHR